VHFQQQLRQIHARFPRVEGLAKRDEARRLVQAERTSSLPSTRTLAFLGRFAAVAR
jgi:hypothetical protein